MSRHCSHAEAFNGGKDVVSALGPRKGLRRGVVDELGDRLLQDLNTAVDASFDLACGENCEEAFDLVEPRRSYFGS
jgi:hypothetical protein